jgi:hypothetical protein
MGPSDAEHRVNDAPAPGRLARLAATVFGSRALALLWGGLVSVLIGAALKGPLTPAATAQGLDLLSWRVFTAITGPGSPATPKAPTATVVLTVSQTYFERGFGQGSPLDRGELARLLEPIAAAARQRAERGERPLVVGIDLDLSPPTRADAPTAAGQRRLDAALAALGRDATVVVLCPFGVGTEEARTIKARWMRERLDAAPPTARGAGLWFATPDLLEQFGAVVHFDPARASLGVVAGGARRSGASMPAPPEAACTAPGDDGARRPRLQKIGQRALGSVTFVELDGPEGVAAYVGAAAVRTVMLGGSYALAADEFATADGRRLPGVVLHAAVADSVLRPVSQHHRFVEPLLGLALAIALQPLVGLALSAGGAFLQPASPWIATDARRAPGTFLLFAPRGPESPELWLRWLAVTAAAPCALALLLFATGLLSWAAMGIADYWVDFGTISVAVFLKACSSMVQRLQAQAAQAGGPAPDGDARAGRGARLGLAVRATVLGYGAVALAAKLVTG